MIASRGRGTSVAWDWAQQQFRTAVQHVEVTRLRTLAQRADLLELLDDGRSIRFSHQLIQEYFAALALRERLVEAERLRQSRLTRWLGQQKIAHYAAPAKRTGWEETLLLLAGIEGKDGHAHELVRVFMSQPLKAAELLLAEGEGVDPALLEEVRQTALDKISDRQCLPHERIDAGRALGLVGDPRFPVVNIQNSAEGQSPPTPIRTSISRTAGVDG